MPISFDITSEVVSYKQRIRSFIDEVVIPREQEAFIGGLNEDLRRELQAAAREWNIWAPQASSALGGGGFDLVDSAVLLEEAGTSPLGPLALNCSAPDEGNIHLLDVVATQTQRAEFLRPLVAGEVRSCFAMTEPVPGAGSDPAALQTRCERRADGWHITGRKHLITGADGAAFAIVMAAGGNSDGSGATMFLIPTGIDGWNMAGHTNTIDSTMIGGHCHIELEDIVVGDDLVLGAPGEGFRYAQVRLAPARLTHCMRWLGAARRSHQIALGHAVRRELFGSRLAELGMAQAMIADNEIDLHASRALLWHACWQLDQGAKGTEESSRAKVFISEAVGRIVDRSVQLCGGLGTSEELVVGRIYADIRAFRIYDGSSESHRMSIARRAARRTRADLGL